MEEALRACHAKKGNKEIITFYTGSILDLTEQDSTKMIAGVPTTRNCRINVKVCEIKKGYF